ncbi:MAG: PqqD family protein [Burkholderiaceae bacterium]|nr:PqqD family protein [Burkholderiaceae bacterium]
MADIWNTRISQSPDVLHQELGGETVLLNLVDEHYFGLDPVGSRIWQLLGETGQAEAIVGQLLQEYDVDEQQLRGDVERLVQELLGAGLVQLAAPVQA